MKLFFCMAIVALLCGCAGTNFSFDNARQIKPGMKSAEVQKRMGKPYMVTT
jgi:outer membrane protein assembly factor BamE (lipoprotein component of BamABCDE complex)